MLDVCGVDFKKGFWRYHGVNMAIHVEVPSHGKVLPRMSWRWTRSLQATRPGLSLGVPGTSGKLCLFGWFWLVVSTCVKYGVIMCYFHFFSTIFDRMTRSDFQVETITIFPRGHRWGAFGAPMLCGCSNSLIPWNNGWVQITLFRKLDTDTSNIKELWPIATFVGPTFEW